MAAFYLFFSEILTIFGPLHFFFPLGHFLRRLYTHVDVATKSEYERAGHLFFTIPHSCMFLPPPPPLDQTIYPLILGTSEKAWIMSPISPFLNPQEGKGDVATSDLSFSIGDRRRQGLGSQF